METPTQVETAVLEGRDNCQALSAFVLSAGVVLAIPAVVVVAWELGVRVEWVYLVWKLFIAYLIMLGPLLVLVAWRRGKQLEAEVFLEHWGEARERQVAPAASGSSGAGKMGNRTAQADAPLQPTRQGEAANRPGAELKFACPSCGQHIRCEQGYVGKQINCPACQKPIQVPRADAG